MTIWVFLDGCLKKTIAIFEISTLKFAKVKKVHGKPNKFKFRATTLII